MSKHPSSGPRLSPLENAVLRVRLRDYAKQQGWDQRAVGEMVGLTQQGVSTFLNGKSGVGLATGARIAQVVGSTIDDVRDQAAAQSLADLAGDQWERFEWLLNMFANEARAGRGATRETIARSAETLGIPGPLALREWDKRSARPAQAGEPTIAWETRGIRERPAFSVPTSPDTRHEHREAQSPKHGLPDLPSQSENESALELAVFGAMDPKRYRPAVFDAARSAARAAGAVDLSSQDLAIVAGRILECAASADRAGLPLTTANIFMQMALLPIVLPPDPDPPAPDTERPGPKAGGVSFVVNRQEFVRAMEKLQQRPKQPRPAPANRGERRATAKKAPKKK